ncbi:MAG: protein kinase [Phycisphaerae bacterium]
MSEYVLEERIGAGTFGEVWQARHHIWGDEHVAIKLPTEPEYVRYLQREGVVVHGLRHPNVVRVMGLDPYGDIPYLVMELVKGPSLRQVLNEHPKGVPVDTALTVLRGILNAMVTAHANHVLHRDLKPGNVMLHLNGKPLSELTEVDVKVSDFGLGVGNPDTLREIVQSASIDRENKLVGTMAYMAPELRDGRRKADVRSDLYSIGVILFELLTGERPAGFELPSTLRAEVPAALDEVFRGLYARYERRYVSAKAALENLDARLRPLPSRVPPPPPPAPAIGTGRRSCTGCGHVVEGYDQFCTQCGQQLVARVRRCSSCGGYPGPEDVFCIFCGCALSRAAE